MSKNRNRVKYNKAQNSREYTITFKKTMNDYCFICQRRSGNFYFDCSPAQSRARGYHGSGKHIYSYKYREYRTWKYTRKNQWK